MFLRRSKSASDIQQKSALDSISLIVQLKLLSLNEQIDYLKLKVDRASLMRLALVDVHLIDELLSVNLKEHAYVNVVLSLLQPILPKIYEKDTYFNIYKKANTLPAKSRLLFVNAFRDKMQVIINTYDKLNSIYELLPVDDRKSFIEDTIEIPHLKLLLKKCISPFLGNADNLAEFLLNSGSMDLISKRIKQTWELQKALPLIKKSQRINFLYGHLGLDNLRGLIPTPGDLSWLLSWLPMDEYARKMVEDDLVPFSLRAKPYQEIINTESCDKYQSVLADPNYLKIRHAIKENFNPEKVEATKLVLPISKSKFVVLTYDHANIINHYKTWKLHLGCISTGTCTQIAKVHRDKHFFPNHLAILPDQKTLVGWNSYNTAGEEVKFREICLIDLESHQIQTITLPYSESDVLHNISLTTEGNIVVDVNNHRQVFEIIPTKKPVENKIAFQFFNILNKDNTASTEETKQESMPSLSS